MDDAEAFAAGSRGDAAAVMNMIASRPTLIHAREHPNKWTLLHVFARLSMPKAVQQLLSLGADCESRDATFRSPLHFAARADASPAVGSLSTEGATTLAQRESCMLETIKVLLKAGARVTARDNFGLTPLHHAAQAGHTATIELLLTLTTELRLPRAPLEAETNAEERALHLAAAGGHAEAVGMLLRNGAHPEKTNYMGQTALHLAVAGGDAPRALATVREMVKPVWRVNLNAQARDGSAPLHVAAQGGHGKALLLLLQAPQTKRNGNERGVLLGLKDKWSRSALELAKENGFSDIVGCLEATAASREAHRARAPREQEAALRSAMAEMRMDSTRAVMAPQEHMEDVLEDEDEIGEDEQ